MAGERAELIPGGTLTLRPDVYLPLSDLFAVVAGISGLFDGCEVMCIDFLPGVCLVVTTRWRESDGMMVLHAEASGLLELLENWIHSAAVDASTIELGLSTVAVHRGRPGGMDPIYSVERQYFSTGC